MKKIATLAVIPLFAGFLFAQSEQTTRTETTTTNAATDMEGTLVDAGCYTTHTEHRDSTATNPDGTTSTTRSETTRTEEVQCPVTSTTTTFGLVTPSGQYMAFDEPSNTRVVEVVKNHKEWVEAMKDSKPVKVHVVGKPNGGVLVVESVR